MTRLAIKTLGQSPKIIWLPRSAHCERLSPLDPISSADMARDLETSRSWDLEIWRSEPGGCHPQNCNETDLLHTWPAMCQQWLVSNCLWANSVCVCGLQTWVLQLKTPYWQETF